MAKDATKPTKNDSTDAPKGPRPKPAQTKRTNARAGRYLGAEERGRYTPPTPRSRRQSPRWYGPAVLGVLLVGVLLIALNYGGLLPGGTSPWYLFAGIVALFTGFMAMLRFH